MASPKFHNSIRKYHRWLGFFLAGIMAIYATSGILLIFRSTDFLKFPQTEVRQLEPGLQIESLGENLRLKNFKIESESNGVIIFNLGQYDKNTGEATINQLDYPKPLAKLVKLHKATTNSPLFFLNISFGLALLFFVISAFLMFMPKLPFFKNGVKISLAGALFALLVVIFAS
jgi:hypothetical protein